MQSLCVSVWPTFCLSIRLRGLLGRNPAASKRSQTVKHWKVVGKTASAALARKKPNSNTSSHNHASTQIGPISESGCVGSTVRVSPHNKHPPFISSFHLSFLSRQTKISISPTPPRQRPEKQHLPAVSQESSRKCLDFGQSPHCTTGAKCTPSSQSHSSTPPENIHIEKTCVTIRLGIVCFRVAMDGQLNVQGI